MKEVRHTLALIESLRREKVDPTLRTVPTPDGVDYAGSGLLIQHAMAALDEGIPGRQRMRVQHALMAVLEGAADMMRWAQYNGYFSHDAELKGYKAAMEENERLNALLNSYEATLNNTIQARDAAMAELKERNGELRAIRLEQEKPSEPKPTA